MPEGVSSTTRSHASLFSHQVAIGCIPVLSLGGALVPIMDAHKRALKLSLITAQNRIIRAFHNRHAAFKSADKCNIKQFKPAAKQNTAYQYRCIT